MTQFLSTRKVKIILATTLALFVYAFGIQMVFAADLSLSPSVGSYSSGQTFTATVRVVPGGDSVNAVESVMNFNSSVLSVVSVSKNGSVFSLWTTEPTFSNSNGTISFGGGSPTPFTSTSNILNITFRAVTDGTGTVTFGDSSILAADGRGTDVFSNGIGGTYTISPGSTPTPTPETPTPTSESDNSDEAIIFGDPPRPPEIGSPTFLDSEVWYRKTDGLFTWTIPFDVTAVAVEISNDPENIPQDNEEAIITPPVEDFSITKDIITDGVQYVSVNFENQVGWGAVTNRKLQIDTTPPEPFAVNVRAGTNQSSFPLLTFEADDVTSGIQYYDMTVADKEPIRITPDEARLGYLINELEDGTYTVKVIATDMAGNERESSVAVLITAGWVKPVDEVDEVSLWDLLTATNLFIFFLLIIIILMLAYLWYEHKQIKEKEEKLRRETREIQDQMEKIFSALRDEIYDQINTITKRKRLSKNEKDAVEGLTQALEVSETLIEKEINDVRAILK